MDSNHERRVEEAFQQIKPRIMLKKFTAATEFAQKLLVEGTDMSVIEQRIKDFQAGYNAAERNTLEICGEIATMNLSED